MKKTKQHYVDQKFDEFVSEYPKTKCKELGPTDRIKLIIEGGPVNCGGENIDAHTSDFSLGFIADLLYGKWAANKGKKLTDYKSINELWLEWYAEQLALDEPEPAPGLKPGSTHSDSFFKNYLMNGGPPLKWKYDDVDLSDQLEGQTLADICGDDEIFEITYAHALFDIFGIDEEFLSKIEKQLDFKKEVYAKSYEASIKKMIMLRQDGGASDAEI